MDQFWQFAGSYWWLIFPVMGVLGGFGRRWERSARSRHQRRLEILHAKAEVTAAKAAARTGTVRATPAPPRRDEDAATRPTSATSSARQKAADRAARLQKLFAEHDAVTHRWLEYELDVGKMIAYPAMSDGRQPLVAAFLRAKKVADRLRPATADAHISDESFAEYRTAVTDYEVAFEVAEKDARRLRDSTFSAAERKRLDTAKQLLSVAVDQAATPAERQVAYRRVRQELDGLLSLSDEAIVVLEQKVALQLPQPRPPET